MEKIIEMDEAISKIQSGNTVMIGGFLSVGVPHKLIDAIARSKLTDLTIISNDSGFVDDGIGKLISSRKIKKIITSHIGTNKETGRQMMDGEIEVELVPQGTLIERIRSGGFGLGGFLTQTGLGTEVEEGKRVIKVGSKRYLLELPLRANVALLFATEADSFGNLAFRGATRNFNVYMGPAADISIAETQTLVNLGEIDPNHVNVPGVFVDYLVK